jgi:chromosome segregation ATPase
MTRKGSTSVIILSALILTSLSLAGTGFYFFKKEHAKNIELGEKLEELNSKQRITETKLKESERLVADMQLKLEEAKSQIDALTTDLQAEKTAKQEALVNVEKLKADLEEQKGLRSDLEKKVGQAQDEARKAQTQLKELQEQKTALESQKATLESKVKDLEAKSGVELGKIVVNPETTAVQPQLKKKEKITPSAAQEGKVVVVNKDYNFVVVNLGVKDGIDTGQVFSVYHNNKYLGDVKVEKVHDSMSAAGFVSSDIKDRVSEGDKVVQKVK